MLTVVAFLVAIGVLVTIHEYGHYRVAKACGVKVLTFSIGFGKPLLQWQRGETQWQIALIPFGGFVKMLGEEEGSELSPEEKKRAFSCQHPLRKMAIVAAGPLANLLLAWVLFSLVLMAGSDVLKPVVGGVRVGSLAERSGVRPDDEILRLGTLDILQWDDLTLAALDAAGNNSVELVLRTARGAKRELVLDLSGEEGRKPDLTILDRIGFSPLPLLNRLELVQAGSVAERAGLQKGDVITSIDSRPVARWEILQDVISKSPNKEVLIRYRRGADEHSVVLIPQAHETSRGVVGRIGVAPQLDAERWAARKTKLRLTFFDALSRGAHEMQLLTSLTFKLSAAMFSGEVSAKNVSGPVGIASMAGETASLGVAPYLKFLALLSLSLGILNLLPVPVLDGGHLLYHVVELVRGRALPIAWYEIGQRIGIALLVALMMLALYNDINRLIPG